VLTAVALYSNLVEVVVHIMGAGFYILGILNPNESRSPPVPPGRVFLLLLVKLLAEVATDFCLACSHAAKPSAPGAPRPLEALWERHGRAMTLDVCLFAIMWFLDTQTFFVQFLCPSPANGAKVVGVARMMGFDNLLSVGMCR